MRDKLKKYQSYALPVALITIGALILWAQITNFDWLGLTWSFFIILPGLAMLHVAIQDQSQKYARLIFPAIVVLLTGVILLYQSLTNHWRSWTFLWALYVVFFGVGLQIYGRRIQNKNDILMGRNLILGGIATFVFLWMLFELVIFSATFSAIIGYVLPAAFVSGGVVMLANHYRVYRLESGITTEKIAQNETKRGVSTYSSSEIVSQQSDGEVDFSRFNPNVIVDMPEIKPINIDDNISTEIDPELQRKIDAALKGDIEG